MFHRARPLLLGLVLAVAAPVARTVHADDDDPLAGLSGAKALEYAKELSSDAMKGRKTGTEGGRLAESWVQSVMGRIGLDPMDGDGLYLQAFSFPATDVVAPIHLAVDGKEATYGADYAHLLYAGDGTVEADVVFVGYGIVAKERDWDDYEGIDVKGKAVLAVRGAPAGRDGDFLEERQIGWKAALAADRGAAAFLIADAKTPVVGTIQPRFFRANLPAVWVSGAIADRLLAKSGKTLEAWKTAKAAGESLRSFATGSRAKVEVHGRMNPEAQGRNGLGGIVGKDPDLRGEVVIVAAHADHLGVDPTGQVFNGADDNASGVATMIALAETLKRNRWRPKRTVLFVAFAAEEDGLLGAYDLATHLPFTAKGVVAVLNMDMTGQGVPEVGFGGGEGYPGMAKRLLSYVPDSWRGKVKSFRADKNSDHWPFHERGVPAFFLKSEGEHPNYHQPADDAQNLKPECMEAVATVVGRMLVGIATHPEPLSPARELAGYLLREGPRVVEGPRSHALWASVPPAPKDGNSDRSAFVEAGWGAVVVAVPETEWEKGLVDFVAPARARGREWGVVARASDLANTARGARTVAIPRVVCRDAATAAALCKAGVVPDLSALSAEPLAALRKALGDLPATVRADKAAGLAELRRALGPKTLVLVSGAAADLVLTPEALSADADPALAPVCVVDEDTERLTEILVRAAETEGLDLGNPAAPARARVRAVLGGAFVDLLRRLP